jgi:hypothetical protein
MFVLFEEISLSERNAMMFKGQKSEGVVLVLYFSSNVFYSGKKLSIGDLYWPTNAKNKFLKNAYHWR